MMSKLLFLLVAIFVGWAAYVRWAPATADAWHAVPDMDGPGDRGGAGSHIAARQTTATADDVFAAVDRIAMQTPRTTRIAGDVADGMITYETRSAGLRFPDYTTVRVTDDGLLVIYGRLRFGAADLGVNEARVTNWMRQLGPLIVPLD